MKKNNKCIGTLCMVLAICFYLLTEFSTPSNPSSITTTPIAVTSTISDESYTFRNEELLESHYQKHGIEMGYSSAEEYEIAASNVVNNPEALHKTEKEDNDDVYYLEETNEFVIVSTDGYIRTYFYPESGIKYYNEQ